MTGLVHELLQMCDSPSVFCCYQAIINLFYIQQLTISLVLSTFQRNSSTMHVDKHMWIVTPQHKNQ